MVGEQARVISAECSLLAWEGWSEMGASRATGSCWCYVCAQGADVTDCGSKWLAVEEATGTVSWLQPAGKNVRIEYTCTCMSEALG